MFTIGAPVGINVDESEGLSGMFWSCRRERRV